MSERAEHDTESFDCWCGPRLCLPCTDCDGSGCWKCATGLIDLTREQADETDDTVLVIHNERNDARTQ